MSIHSSLKNSGHLIGIRNVWTRVERLEALKKIGKWEDGDPVTGLAKVRTHFKTKSKKQMKADAATDGGEQAETTDEAAPAEAAGSGD